MSSLSHRRESRAAPLVTQASDPFSRAHRIFVRDCERCKVTTFLAFSAEAELVNFSSVFRFLKRSIAPFPGVSRADRVEPQNLPPCSEGGKSQFLGSILYDI